MITRMYRGHGPGVSTKQLRAALLASTVLMTGGASSTFAQNAAHSQMSDRQISVPAGPLTSALNRLAAQTGLQILFDAQLANGKTTRGAQGSLTARQALIEVLAGTGLNARFTGANSATIAGPANVDASAVPAGSIMLDTIDVSGGGRGAASPADRPFTTPGSTNYISEQEIQRFPGNTAGDIFQGVPGVISGTNRSGAAIDPNIRGLQGMNRVATTIDGSEQSTSSYRGYSGVDNRSYVDPDLISGVTITKGPNEGSAGAIGGTVAMETLKPSDILKPGDTYGVRAKVSAATNAIAPQIGATQMETDKPSLFNIDNKSGSVAFAVTQQNIDIVGAYVRRIAGNYFAGSHGDLFTDDFRGGRRLMSKYGHGDEVFNTSQNSSSVLFKTTLRPADDHELQLGYMRYENKFGEIFPSWIAANLTTTIPRQASLSEIALDQFTARYHWKPSDNPMVDLKANAWMSATDELSPFGGIDSTKGIGAKSKNYGSEVSNTSRFEIATMPFALRYGGSMKLEDAGSDYRLSTRREINVGAIAPDGTRQLGSLFVNGRLEPTPWLSLDAGATWLAYRVSNRARPEWSYAGPAFTGYEGSGISPNFSVTVTPVEGWQLFAKYAGGIRPPSLRESTWNASGLWFNPSIVPEKASNWEFGTNVLKNDLFIAGDKTRLKLAYFNNLTKDYLGRSWISANGMSGYLTILNYDKVEINGVELSGGYDARKAFVDFGFNYYTDVEICRTANFCTSSAYQSDYLANQIPPKYSISATGGLRFFDEKLTVGGRYTYMAARAGSVLDDDYSRLLGVFSKAWNPYSLVDLFAQWKINDSLTLDISAENLLDVYYVDAINNTDMPAPGRTIRATLTGKFGHSAPWPEGWLFNRSPGAAPGADWTGLYIGGHVGQGFAELKGLTTAMDGSVKRYSSTESSDLDLSNFLLGGQLGFNYQFGNRFVLGVEADYTKSRLQGFQEAISTEASLLAPRNQLESKLAHSINWIATIRGRLGYAFDRMFVYGTGGVAFLKEAAVRDQYRATTPTASPSATEKMFSEGAEASRTGWVMGGGVEYALTSNWSLKGEYSFASFDEESLVFPNARSGVTQGYTRLLPRPVVRIPGTFETVDGRLISNALDMHLLKFGLNYRF